MDNQTALSKITAILEGWQKHNLTGTISLDASNGVITALRTEVVEKFTAAPKSNGVRFVEQR